MLRHVLAAVRRSEAGEEIVGNSVLGRGLPEVQDGLESLADPVHHLRRERAHSLAEP